MAGSASHHCRSAARALRHWLRRPLSSASSPVTIPVPANASLATRHPIDVSRCSTIDPLITRPASSVGGYRASDGFPGDTWRLSSGSFQHSPASEQQNFPISIAARGVASFAFRSSPTASATAADADVAASRGSAQDSSASLLPSSGAPVVSPLVTATSQLPSASPASRTVRAVLAGLKQGPKKVNLVAAMVRGMTPDDALMQMAVSSKQAAKTVAKVVTAAKANAVHNHGLEERKLIIAEAFVGKGRYLKRLNPHGRGRSGVKHRYRSRLTVVVREMTEREEERVEKQRAAAASHRWMRRVQRKRGVIVPHKVVEVGRRKEEGSEVA